MSGSDRGPIQTTAGRLGDYEVLFELAKGGMATVHLARQSGDAGFERLVAIKRVHAHLVSDPEVFAMASDEARVAALVRHPNVVAVTGVFDTRGELVLVQEYVEGFSLARLLRALAKVERRLPRAVAAHIALDLARGLAATHGARDLRGEPLGIVHRDVSPENVLVGTDGTARLIDFGIARSERRMTATRTGILKGKLAYMAPEQIAEEEVDPRADLYAAGVVLFEMLTGSRAFTASDDAGLMAKILGGTVGLEKVPEEWRALVERALARRPADRFADASELARAIREVGPIAGEEEVSALVTELFSAELDVLRERIASTIARVEDPVDDAVAAARELPTAAMPQDAARRTDHVRPSEGSGRPSLVLAGVFVGAGIFGAGWLVSRTGEVGPVASPRPGSVVTVESSSGAPSAFVAPLGSSTVSAAPSIVASATPSSAPSISATPKARATPSSVTAANPVTSGTGSASARSDLQPSPYAK
jgi:eukaryotic-like serine/threonine-protein kinase